MLLLRARGLTGFAKRCSAPTRYLSTKAVEKTVEVSKPTGARHSSSEASAEAPEDLEHKRLGSLWTNVWFPYEPVPVSCQLKPYIVNVKGGHGETYYYDASGESMTQPWCDGKPRKGGVKWEAVVYQPRRDGYKLICGCKMALNAPKCDGTCAVMWADYNPAKGCAYIFGGGFLISVTLSYLLHP